MADVALFPPQTSHAVVLSVGPHLREPMEYAPNSGTRPEAGHIPDAFCWTRFGTEAGESVERILARKEAERAGNHGIFLWGIGNSVAPGLRELLRRGIGPEVLFSPIKGQPRSADVDPPRVVSWTAAETMDGTAVDLAPSVRVLSRAPAHGTPPPHYALVCFSPVPLQPSDYGSVQFGAVRNLASGSRVGASQVTAVVALGPSQATGALYPVSLRARLIAPYFLRLRSPQAVWPQPAAS